MVKTACLVGVDGAGKSTCIETIIQRNKCIKSVSWHAYGEVIDTVGRLKFNKKCSPAETVSELDKVTRTAIIQLLVSLEASEICERKIDNTTLLLDSYWYRFAAKSRSMNFLNDDFETWCLNLPVPDVVFFLDTPIEECFRRKPPAHLYERGDEPGAELQFQEKVRENLLSIISPFPHVIINGLSSPDVVCSIILRVLQDEH